MSAKAEKKDSLCEKWKVFHPPKLFSTKWHFGRDFSQVKLAVNTNEGIKWYLSRGGARKKVGWEVRKVLHVIADVPTTTWKGWLHGHHFIIFFMPFFLLFSLNWPTLDRRTLSRSFLLDVCSWATRLLSSILTP